MTKLFKVIDEFTGQRILIIGDMVADVYLEGKISRVSREAPVLVLEHMGEIIVPGGAANVVHNAATLGGDVVALGVLGDDYTGHDLKRVLATKNVNTSGLIIDKTRPTITKTRVMAGGQATVRQQVVRIDREAKVALAENVERQLLQSFFDNLDGAKVVILSDYGIKTLSPSIASTVIDACRDRNIPCVVDSRYDILQFKGVSVVKQNEAEVAAVLKLASLEGQSLTYAGQTLLTRLEAEAVLLTRGPEGMTLFECGDKVTNIPVTNVTEVFDVSGAGDTAVAALSLAMAAGADYVVSAQLANYAAGVVVRKFGTATTNQKELKEAIGAYHENF